MANIMTNVLPKILARGVEALRENAIFSRLVNSDYKSDAQKLGNAVNVPIPSAIAARAVTASPTFNSNVDATPTVAVITLDQWYESPINISDADTNNVDSPDFLRMEGGEAIKSLINTIDGYIWGKHVGFYRYVGAAGTTPFNTSLTVAGSARLALNQNLAPMDSRRAVLDPNAEALFLMNSQVLDFDKTGSDQGIINGAIGRKLGIDWYMNQNVTTFTPGTGWATGFTVSTTTGVAGGSTLHILNATASGSVKIGDLFTLASDSKQYVVTAAATASATVGIDISIYPPLSAAVSVGTTLAVVGTAYTVNTVFHRDGWAFASRPLSGVFAAGNIFQAPTDPVSGVALRLELSRQYKQETLSFDALWGAQVVRRELGVKIFG